MKYIVLGTAGHIDHGKTSLIRALTGIDTDRLKEEKERGITIELGFAYLDLPGGHRVGIVDVPGHEKFVKHLLAGAAGIDAVLLIIAADEGVMPQTREHFDICKLLCVKAGIVVITKIDLVNQEWLELIREDVVQLAKGSFMENAPIVYTSATSGIGINELISAVTQLVETVKPREGTVASLLPVDRVFTMKGFGTVVTGTLFSGSLKVGQKVEVLPSGKVGRIRGLQVHGVSVQEVVAGQRSGVNLIGLEKSDIRRGEVITGPGSMESTYMVDVRLFLLPRVKKGLRNRRRIRFHWGASGVSFCWSSTNSIHNKELFPCAHHRRGNHYRCRSTKTKALSG